MKTPPLTFLLVVWLAACEDRSDLRITTNSYLPLQIGNSWTFESTNQNADGYFVKRVTDIVTLNGHTYYEIISSWSKSVGDTQDVAYYREDENGLVYILRMGNNLEENRFRLNARDGETWSYPIDDDTQATISLTVSTLRLGSNELKDCKQYSFDVENWADEENTISLAKGIGFVKEYSYAWGNGYILKSAIINGQEINL